MGESGHDPVQGAARLARLSVLLPVLMLGACDVPNSMHVTTGLEPTMEDDQVRFRTTYYFRVFDLCETNPSAPGSGSSIPNILGMSGPKKGTYIAKDSIYRFRMTGKASSLFSKVHFESGTLKSYQIDPFGADIAFDSTNRRFYVRNQDETQDDARRSATMARIRLYEEARNSLPERDPARDDYDALIRNAIRSLDSDRPPQSLASEVVRRLIASSLEAQNAAIAAVEGEKASLVAQGDAAKVAAVDLILAGLKNDVKTHGEKQARLRNDLIGLFREASETAEKAVNAASLAVDETDKSITDRKNKLPDAIKNDPPKKKDAEEKLDDELRRVRLQLATALVRQDEIRRAGNAEFLGALQPAPAARGSDESCAAGSITRRGFQILGPEGLRTFNQDERLVMAMTSDGGPLISSLQELSGRVLTPKISDAEQLLPLATERNRLGTARRELEAAPADLKNAKEKIDAAIKTLDPKVVP